MKRLWVAVCLAAFWLAGCDDSGGSRQPPNLVTKHVVLVGAQENPPVTTAATGTGFFTINADTGEVSGTVNTTGVTATAAHIHLAAVGVNGPVIVPLTQGPPGTWTVASGAMLSEAQRTAFREGNLYVNVHSAANPGGEIRAQLGRQVFYATLRGAQENPAVTTEATGTGTFIYDPDTRTLSGSVTTSGLTGTAAHVHTAAVGVNGPVTIPMTGGPTWTLPATVLTQAQASDLLAGRMYANVHSAANPGGEIRGQIYAPVRMAIMSGAAEVPAVTTTATGTCWVSVNPVTMAAAGRIETSIQAGTGAHMHRGAATATGPVVFPFTSPSAGLWTGTQTLTDEVLARFMEGNVYCNVHTAANPGGEVRGQLVPML